MDEKTKKFAEDIGKKVANEVLYESSLSRIKNHMTKYDTGLITAFRSNVKMDDGEIVYPTREQNLKRNNQLFAELNRKYDITKVQGKYIENYGTPDEKEVGENTFFVVDSRNTGYLENDLRNLGEKFQQDSILFIPKGAEEGIVWGTNKANPQAWPGYGNSSKLKYPIFGKSDKMMTKVRGRPFIFTEYGEMKEVKRYYQNYLSEMGRQAFINSDWRKI